LQKCLKIFTEKTLKMLHFSLIYILYTEIKRISHQGKNMPYPKEISTITIHVSDTEREILTPDANDKAREQIGAQGPFQRDTFRSAQHEGLLKINGESIVRQAQETETDLIKRIEEKLIGIMGEKYLPRIKTHLQQDTPNHFNTLMIERFNNVSMPGMGSASSLDWDKNTNSGTLLCEIKIQQISSNHKKRLAIKDAIRNPKSSLASFFISYKLQGENDGSILFQLDSVQLKIYDKEVYKYFPALRKTIPTEIDSLQDLFTKEASRNIISQALDSVFEAFTGIKKTTSKKQGTSQTSSSSFSSASSSASSPIESEPSELGSESEGSERKNKEKLRYLPTQRLPISSSKTRAVGSETEEVKQSKSQK